jgi:hypothetical protein
MKIGNDKPQLLVKKYKVKKADFVVQNKTQNGSL